MFIVTKSNFAQVDKLINDINCGFSLNDVSGTRCEDDIRNLEISAKVVECDTAKHTVVSLVDYSDTNSSVLECVVTGNAIYSSVFCLFS